MKLPGRTFLGATMIAATTLLTIERASAADLKLALKDEPRPSNIRLQETEMGVVFADSRGMTLYTDREDPKTDVPACTDKPWKDLRDEVEGARYLPPPPPFKATCLTQHFPVEVGDAKPVGAWTVIERSNGVKQWAYRGHLVYTSIKDITPGTSWASIEPGLRQYRNRWLPVYAPLDLPPDVILQPIGAARVLATFSGRTLYTLVQDRPNKSMCEGACAEKWQPFLGGAISQPRGEWTLTPRADGSRQWTFRGKPLYTFKADETTGEAKGNNIPGSQVAVIYAAPTPAPFVGIQTTPMGDVYADANGKTLYAFLCLGNLDCDDVGDKTNWWFVSCGNTPEKCLAQWQPVLAAPDAKPMNNTWTIVNMALPWSPVRTAGGSIEKSVRVWAQNGRPLFIYTHEDRPGMIDGLDVGTQGGGRFYAIFATGGTLNAKGPTTQAAR